MDTFKTRIVVNGNRYVVRSEFDDGTGCTEFFSDFDALCAHLRKRLPIYPVCDGTKAAPEPESIFTPGPAPGGLEPAAVHGLPSRFQIGMPVNVVGTVVGVLFREGEVNYEVALGTTTELGEPDVTLVRAYDVEPRVMSHVGGGWA